MHDVIGYSIRVVSPAREAVHTRREHGRAWDFERARVELGRGVPRAARERGVRRLRVVVVVVAAVVIAFALAPVVVLVLCALVAMMAQRGVGELVKDLVRDVVLALVGVPEIVVMPVGVVPAHAEI